MSVKANSTEVNYLTASEDNEFDDSDTFPCKYCGYETASVEDLDEHIITHEEAIFEDYDDRESIISDQEDTESSFNDVEKSTDETIIGSLTDGQNLPAFYQQFADKKNKVVFVCPYCGYQTMKFMDHHKHLKDHSAPIYSCAECLYMTKRKADINRHLLKHCNYIAPIFKCQNCSYETTRKYDLTRHMICHDEVDAELVKDNFLFKCTECGYTSKRLSDLHRHMVLHCDRTVTNAFKCTKCGYATVSGSPFAKHILSRCKYKEMPLTVLPEDNV